MQGPKEPTGNVVQIRMSADLTHRVDQARAIQELSRASLLRVALAAYLDKFQQEPIDDNAPIVLRIPHHIATRLGVLAESLGITPEQVGLSVLGFAAAQEYINQLGKLADDLKQARKGSP